MSGKRNRIRRRRKRKLIVLIVEVLILAIVVTGLYFYQKMNLINTKELDQTKVEVNDVTEETKVTFEGYTTIALFGLDNREMGQYESGNSDCIIIMNINNDTKEMNMVSVYRDTFLNVAASGDSDRFRKCNAAYAAGGAEQAVTMLNRNLDLDIDNYVAFDFKAVAEAIDILGGVEIEITSEAELGYLNDYISYTASYVGQEPVYVQSTGVQQLNGVQAVSYARIRYTAGGDYKRAERQRRVFSQMIKKAKKANIVQINELINEVFPDISTDLTNKQMLEMASAMLGYDMGDSCGFPFERTTSTPNSTVGSIVIPCDLKTNVEELHKLLFDTDDYEPSETVLEYNDYIINYTGIDADDAASDQFDEEDDFDGTGGSSTEDESTSEDGTDSTQ